MPVATIQWQERFESEVDAVVAAANVYNPYSIRHDQEFMGAILRCGGGYFYSAAAGVPGRDEITVKIGIPKGCDLTSFWHTHGDHEHQHKFFSATDVDLVRTQQKPLYLADYTGILKVLSPNDQTMGLIESRRYGLAMSPGSAVGKVVTRLEGVLRVATKMTPQREITELERQLVGSIQPVPDGLYLE
ncbi:DUF4329 domain-containing protein [Marinibactrum halimedae]|uniref:DUF4329 domain-containing protein n=1 Tax=Marinibactrum halimedae TaxID=1444977 RepID=A0AA37T545_9GAMM|nr:DUF4329 domain-containing protein [Marinibactrum halimedae]GLS27383.1 hypothetical protein GCM10007877_31020 [Marinibactrum halimedae]